MRKLLIIGAGNVGGFISYNLHEFGCFELVGFLDDDATKHGQMRYGQRVIGSVDEISNFRHEKDLAVAIAISAPKARHVIYEKLKSFAFTYPNFIGRNVWISKSVSMGQGVILYPGVSINYETRLGDFVIANMNCAIGHNCTLMDFSTLAPGVNLAGFTRIESRANIGIGVSTRQNVVVGVGANVGGQSMVVKDVAPETTVAGVPARKLK